MENDSLLKFDFFVKNQYCAVNFISTGKEMKKIFSCKCRTEKELKICEKCINSCHKGHAFFQLESTNGHFVCDCARLDHFAESNKDVKVGKDYKKFMKKPTLTKPITEEVYSCKFLELFQLSNLSSSYTLNESIICPICAVICVNRDCSRCVTVCEVPEHYLEKRYILNKNEICSCEQVIKNKKHQPFQNIEHLRTFFKDPISTGITNLIRVSEVLLNNKNNYHYWEVIYETNKAIMETKKTLKYQNQESLQYVKSCLLMIELNKYVFKNCYIEITSQKLNKEFFFSTLKTLFNTVEIKDDAYSKYKYLNMKIFRKYFIMPKVKNSLISNIQFDYNTNPFHRMLLIKSTQEFFSLIKISKADFFSLLDKMATSILNYITKINDEEVNKLFKEYLRWIIVLIDFRLSRQELVSVLDKIDSIISEITSM